MPATLSPATPSSVAPPVAPPASGRPCRVPARTVRIGPVPRPRVRSLAEVLDALPRTAVPAAPAAGAHPDPAAELDAVAAAARPAALALCGMVAEVLDGRRAAAELRALCTDDVDAAAVVRLAPRRRSPTRGRVSTVRVCPVGPGAVEVGAVVHRDGRARGVAARLERDDAGTGRPGRPGRGWRVHALAVL